MRADGPLPRFEQGIRYIYFTATVSVLRLVINSTEQTPPHTRIWYLSLVSTSSLWNSKVRHRVRNSTPPRPRLSHLNRVLAITPSF
jgi:hypothetical protein